MRRLVFGSALLALAVFLAGCTATAGASGSGQDKSTAPERVTVQLRADGSVIASGATAFVQDGELYVPASKLGILTDRFVRRSEDGLELIVERRPASARAPLVPNQPWEFADKVASALKLLQDRTPQYVDTVNTYAAAILPDHNYNQAYGGINVITLSDATIQHASLAATAATIAHEAEHLRIEHSNPDLAKNLKENERAAYRVTLDVLKFAGGSDQEVSQAEGWVKDPPTSWDVRK